MWIIYIFGLIVVGSLAYAAYSGAPWVPTWKKDLVRIEKLLDLKDGDKFIELGSGNGRVCRYLAKNSQADVCGLELSLLQHGVSLFQNLILRSKARAKFGNVFNHDLSKYNAVYLFLMPETYKKIRVKFDKELKPGTRVVSYVWPIEGWVPNKVDEVEGSSKLFLYIV
jgi:tRNA A58 N-methylase Trm61